MWVYLLAIVIIWYTYRWYRDQQRLGNHGDRYVLITGCDTGFGNLLAKELDRLGFHVFAGCLTEIGAADLDKETSKNVKPLQLNVCSEESIRSVFATVKSSLPDGKGTHVFPSVISTLYHCFEVKLTRFFNYFVKTVQYSPHYRRYVKLTLKRKLRLGVGSKEFLLLLLLSFGH